MGLVMTILISVSGYFILTHALVRNMTDRTSKLIGAVTIFVVYSLFMVILYGILFSLGAGDNGSLMFVIISGCIAIVSISMFLRQHVREMNAWTIVLLLYIAAILVVCVFARNVQDDRLVNEDVSRTITAVQEGDASIFGHFVMNVVMFMPFGILLPKCCPGHLEHLIEIVMPALLFSNCVECVQLVFKLGNCDIEDIIANVAGAVFGWLFLKLYHRVEYM